ncbi:MAG TPA: 4,5-DOPA dioxygenase extradiol [Verrucomicrobiae bacterium]|nr:4,5-DOPA dioxygenase extradiol [Verrucomicrobiae bacterium]
MMPVVFCAHGNPMNAIRDNRFTRFLRGWGPALPKPRAVLAISAHWEAARLAVTAAARPETIHDFYGFPEELFAVRYPAPGDPGLASRIESLLRAAGLDAAIDAKRGLDHGAWAPLRCLYPDASVPVVQLSLLAGLPFARHVEVGRALAPLRHEGVLVLGSGNLVHNLRTADLFDERERAVPWALEFDAWVAASLHAWDLEALAAFMDRAPQGRLAHPTAEHYVPLLVAAGAASAPSGAPPRVSFPFEGFEHATISLRCVTFS